MNTISIITSNYPSSAQPALGTFVQQTAIAFARQGVKVTVIQPVAVHRAISRNHYPYHQISNLKEGCAVTIYRPRFLSFSARDSFRKLGVFNPSRFTFLSFCAAASRTLRRESLNPDVLYGHFLYMAGACAVRVGRKLGIPAFPCVGEGEFWTLRWFGKKQARKDLASAAGFLANSTAIKQALIDELQIEEKCIGVFPNGVDLSVFSPKEKRECLRLFGLPENTFLVCSAGSFLYNKGVVRVGEAIEGLEGVAGVFAGSGPLPPQASNTAFCGRVSHDQMPYLMSACDLFVLPTLIEGSCNAIVEAMACGLPVISSIGAFNDDLLTDDMSIRVDPLEVAVIRESIMKLRDDRITLKKMADAATSRARHCDINVRAARILEFFKQAIEPLENP